MNSATDKDLLIKFGNHIAAIRKSKNLSLRKLATKCDIDHSDIRKYEKGEKNMTFLTMVEFSKGLEVELKVLIDF